MLCRYFLQERRKARKIKYIRCWKNVTDFLNPVCVIPGTPPLWPGFRSACEHRGMACIYTPVNKILYTLPGNMQAVLLWSTRGFSSGLQADSGARSSRVYFYTIHKKGFTRWFPFIKSQKWLCNACLYSLMGHPGTYADRLHFWCLFFSSSPLFLCSVQFC